MKRIEFERIAQKVLEGHCPPEEFAQLEAALQSSAELRRVYRETFLIDGMLGREAEERGPGSASASPVVPVETLLRHQRRKALAVALTAAAVLVLATVGVLKMLWVRSGVMATVRAAPHTVWDARSVDGSTADSANLRPGDEIRIREGTVELTLGDGVKGWVQGPARLVVEGEGRLGMSYGTGRFQVGKGAEGFTVRSRRLDVVDLGTDFGMIVPEKDAIAPEVHVFEGRVRASAVGGLARSVELVAGEAGRVDPVGRFLRIRPDDRRFFTSLPDDLPFIRLGFDSEGGGRFQVEGTHAAVPKMKVFAEGQAVPTSGVLGSGVRFAEPGSRVATDWPGTLGDAPRTMAAWVRIPPGLPHQRYQTIAGWGDPTIGFAAKFEMLVIRPEPGRPSMLRLSFDQFLFTGTTDLADGRWHHVAAVYEGGLGNGTVRDRVRLYVDGVPEPLNPRLTEVAKLPSEPRTREGGFPLVVGDLPVLDDPRTFRGEIDELVIFEAALDESRIRALAGESE